MLNFVEAYPNLFSALLLFILFIIIYVRRDFYTVSQRVFFALLIATMFVLIFEGLSFLVDGSPGIQNRNLNYTLNFGLFLVFPVALALWANYIDLQVHGSVKRLVDRVFYLPPSVIMIFMLAMNSFQPVLFSIDDDNLYERELGIYIVMAMLVLLCLYFIIMLLRNAKQLKQRLLFGILALIVLPMIGGGLQMLTYGIATFHSMFALGLVTAYIAIENIAVNTDELTNLFTRRTVFAYIESKIRRQAPYTLIVFNIDNLREMNDEFGHHIGDKALIEFTEAIQKKCDCRGMVSRIGGSEFLVVSDMLVTQEIEQNLRLIQAAVDSIEVVEVRISYGFVCSLEYPGFDVEGLLQVAYERMAEQKMINRSLIRQKESSRRTP